MNFNAVIPGATSAIPRRQHPAHLQGEIWGVIAHFNPAGYTNKLDHLSLAASRVRRQGLRLLIVEAAFSKSAFAVSSELADVVVQVISPAILWQKEALLNIGIAALPRSCDKVVWLDGDVMFGSDEWVRETASLLNSFVMVQPFVRALWLKPHIRSIPDLDSASMGDSPAGIERVLDGTAFHESSQPSSDYPHGHPGFAWAARRSVIDQHGLYDRLVLGGADILMAGAMYGIAGPAVQRFYCNERQISHIAPWMSGFHGSVQGSVAFCSGNIYHLWHGDHKKRQYQDRYSILVMNEFDPVCDISRAENGTWDWGTHKPRLHESVRQYFWDRDEAS